MIKRVTTKYICPSILPVIGKNNSICRFSRLRIDITRNSFREEVTIIKVTWLLVQRNSCWLAFVGAHADHLLDNIPSLNMNICHW